MEVTLRRTEFTDETGPDICGICEHSFVLGSVYGCLSLDGLVVCPACIAYLGKRNPEKFPTIEEYEEAKQRYPEPIRAISYAEFVRLIESLPHEEARDEEERYYNATWLS